MKEDKVNSEVVGKIPFIQTNQWIYFRVKLRTFNGLVYEKPQTKKAQTD